MDLYTYTNLLAVICEKLTKSRWYSYEKRIKELSKKRAVSISQLNEICELSKNTIAQSGRGTDGMKAKNLFMIAETLDCSVDYLLGRTDSPEIGRNVW